MVEKFWRNQVHFTPAQQDGQFILNINEIKPRGVTFFKFHQYINIATRVEIVAQD